MSFERSWLVVWRLCNLLVRCARGACLEEEANMDPSRDIQHFKRNIATRSTVSSCSSLAMEIKRKKIRESVFFQNEVSLFCWSSRFTDILCSVLKWSNGVNNSWFCANKNNILILKHHHTALKLGLRLESVRVYFRLFCFFVRSPLSLVNESFHVNRIFSLINLLIRFEEPFRSRFGLNHCERFSRQQVIWFI